MTTNLSRRDFLKLASILSLAPLWERIHLSQVRNLGSSRDQNLPNIIVILFDTLSARHLPIYGYPRSTSPNLERFSQKATVFHAHYSAGNYTTPSTASFFTGTYPWTHRAFHESGIIGKKGTESIFSLLRERYHLTGFAHNPAADVLLYQFDDLLDQHIAAGAFSLFSHTYYDHLFSNDSLNAFRSFEKFLFRGDPPGSLFLSFVNKLVVNTRHRSYLRKYADHYPRGIPNTAEISHSFVLESLFEGVIHLLNDLPNPSFAYLHLFPPHEPYYPHKKYLDMFNDHWSPGAKEPHFLSEGLITQSLNKQRLRYDQYVAHTDAEFGRLLDAIEKTGLLNNSYVIVTSDHGQLFERGVHGHFTPLLYESIIHVPLLISIPGQQERVDIFTPTSTVDLLPTFLHLSDLPIPDWCEGEVLPGLGGKGTLDRGVFSVEAKTNPSHSPLTTGTVALIRDNYKLIRYIGYPGFEDVYELYDLKDDPDEFKDIYTQRNGIAGELQAELDGKLKEVNQPYLE